MSDEELLFLREKLKSGEYDGADIMQAWAAIDKLRELIAWRKKAVQAIPHLDSHIEKLSRLDRHFEVSKQTQYPRRQPGAWNC